MNPTPIDLLIPSPEPPIQFPVSQIQIFDAEVDTLIRTAKARNSFQVTGKGLTVAVLDTGLRITHHDFVGRIRTQRNFTTDNGGDPNDVRDDNGHGTNVTGIIAARIGNHTGIAPDAGIVPLKVLQNTGPTPFTTTREALQWVLDHHEEHQITVVSLSLGDPNKNLQNDDSFADDEVRRLIRQLRDRRIPAVVAAGNGYFKFQIQGMSYPAILRETVSVGAVYDANVGNRTYKSGAEAFSTAADRITPFSQRLHETTNANCRTDIFAPGAPITSSGSATDDGESIQSGTSQATPVISGVLLLMQELYLRTKSELPPVDFLVTCLRNGAVALKDGDDEDDNVTHTGARFLRVDVMNALDAVRRQLQLELLTTATAFRLE